MVRMWRCRLIPSLAKAASTRIDPSRHCIGSMNAGFSGSAVATSLVSIATRKLNGQELALQGARLRRNVAAPRGYLITLAARTSTFGGIVKPICFAAFRLTTNSNFIGCSTGRSAGLAP